MTKDMVYDIVWQHNPMLACMAQGYGILECSPLYRGLGFGLGDNGHKHVLSRDLYYRIGHAAGKDNILFTPPKILSPKRQKKTKPFRGPVYIPNYSRDGSVHYKRIDFKKLW